MAAAAAAALDGSFLATTTHTPGSSHDASMAAAAAWEAQAQEAQKSCSDSDDDLCGPHQDCCGGTLLHGAYNPCVKRLGKGGFQHSRGQVCLSQHKFFQCATCKNVAHSGCWVRTAKGSFMLPSALTPFHCYTCACKKDEEQSTSLPTACKKDHEESTSLPTGAQGTAKPCVSEGTTTKESTFLSESDLRKHFKHKQRSLCTPQMPHLECPAKSF
jgi:hypothetical protein